MWHVVFVFLQPELDFSQDKRFDCRPWKVVVMVGGRPERAHGPPFFFFDFLKDMTFTPSMDEISDRIPPKPTTCSPLLTTLGQIELRGFYVALHMVTYSPLPCFHTLSALLFPHTDRYYLEDRQRFS